MAWARVKGWPFRWANARASRCTARAPRRRRGATAARLQRNGRHHRVDPVRPLRLLEGHRRHQRAGQEWLRAAQPAPPDGDAALHDLALQYRQRVQRSARRDSLPAICSPADEVPGVGVEQACRADRVEEGGGVREPFAGIWVRVEVLEQPAGRVPTGLGQHDGVQPAQPSSARARSVVSGGSPSSRSAGSIHAITSRLPAARTLALADCSRYTRARRRSPPPWKWRPARPRPRGFGRRIPPPGAGRSARGGSRAGWARACRTGRAEQRVPGRRSAPQRSVRPLLVRQGVEPAHLTGPGRSTRPVGREAESRGHGRRSNAAPPTLATSSTSRSSADTNRSCPTISRRRLSGTSCSMVARRPSPPAGPVLR